MRPAASGIVLAVILATGLVLPTSASATSPAYKGYCGKQAKKFHQILRSQNKAAGIFQYSRKNHTSGSWCFAKYKIWDTFSSGKITYLSKPQYIPGKCLAMPNYTTHWGTQVEGALMPPTRARGRWVVKHYSTQGFGPMPPGAPGSFNPHGNKAVKAKTYKLQLLDNCVFIASYRNGTGYPGNIFLTSFRRNWASYFQTPSPTADMSDNELRAVKATPVGDSGAQVDWTELGIPHMEILVDDGVPTKT
jgi:hypothetical protein